MHRRELLVALGLTSLAVPSIVRPARAGQDADDEQGVDVLFVQTANSVSLDEGKLRMKGVAPSTLSFSDRPERVAGHVPTSVVFDSWGVGGDDSFELDTGGTWTGNEADGFVDAGSGTDALFFHGLHDAAVQLEGHFGAAAGQE